MCVWIGYKWISILIAVTNSFNIQSSIDSENQMRCVTTTDVITYRCGENEWFWLIPFMTAQFTSSFTWLFAFPHFDMRHQLKYDVFFSINFNSKGAIKVTRFTARIYWKMKTSTFVFMNFQKWIFSLVGVAPRFGQTKNHHKMQQFTMLHCFFPSFMHCVVVNVSIL